MDNFIPPVIFNRNSAYTGSVTQPGPVQGDAVTAVSSLFLQTMLKEIYKNQFKNELFTTENNPSSSVFSDMFVEQMINEMANADTFGLNKMISSAIEPRDVIEESKCP
ncbi:MAG: hypothetical protein NTZ10_07305 [Candidatus Saganbacteria bacterium]|nr:hypothetical protein [Candidatus Saganbacteria bacterium]